TRRRRLPHRPQRVAYLPDAGLRQPNAAAADGQRGRGDRVHHLLQRDHRGPPGGRAPADRGRLGHGALELGAQVGQGPVGGPPHPRPDRRRAPAQVRARDARIARTSQRLLRPNGSSAASPPNETSSRAPCTSTSGTAPSRARCRFSPVAVDLAVSTSSYAVFSAVVSACRAAVKSPPPTERSSPASASYT